jgi:4-amino-4-deoxy-L-arabinose transferase-like glycosyltransferase
MRCYHRQNIRQVVPSDSLSDTSNNTPLDAYPPLNIKVETFCLILIILLVTVIRINLIQVPFERDEGAYIYFGQMILEGQTPYIDFLEDKPPGLFYSYAAIVAIFGYGLANLHGAFLLINIISLYLLFLIVKRMYGSIPALASSIAFAGLSVSHQVSGFTCLSEHLIIFFVAIALYLLLKNRTELPWWRYLLAGLSLGMTVWIKQSGIFFLAWGFLFLLSNGYIPLIRRWRTTLWYSIGFLSLSAFFLLLMVAIGAFSQFWYSVFELPRLFVASKFLPYDDTVEFLHNGWDLFRETPVAIIFFMTGIIVSTFNKKFWHEKYFLILFSLFSFAALMPGFTFYGHYWLQVVPAMVIGAGAGVAILPRYLNLFLKGRERTGYLVVLMIFVLGTALSEVSKIDYYFGNDTTRVLRTTYGLNPFPSIKRLGEFLRNRTSPNEKIVILGSEPEILVYSRCRNATRHAFVTHLVNGDNPMARQWTQEFIRDAENAHVRYIVFVNNGLSWYSYDNKMQDLLYWAIPYLQRYYEPFALAEVFPDEDHPRLRWYSELGNYTPRTKLWTAVYRRRD